MDEDEEPGEWAPLDEVSDNLKAKVLALKVCRNRSLAHASSEKALDIATPVLKMLATLIDHDGSFSADAVEEYGFQSLLHQSTIS